MPDSVVFAWSRAASIMVVRARSYGAGEEGVGEKVATIELSMDDKFADCSRTTVSGTGVMFSTQVFTGMLVQCG